MPKPGRIRVVGSVLKPPLLDTAEATVIEFYDSYGDMNALLVRMFTDDIWALCTKLDPDWESTLIRLGYINVRQTTAQVIQSMQGA